jgi:hypothetical protein
VVGLVSHFWLGATDATTWSAAMIAASVLLFAAEIGPPLLSPVAGAAVFVLLNAGIAAAAASAIADEAAAFRWSCAAPFAAAALFAAALARRVRTLPRARRA